MPGTETLLKRRIEVVARSHYLDLSNDPASALPSPTPKGAETFTQCILDRVFALGVIPRAMEAARACDVQRVYGKSVLQEKLADALRDLSTPKQKCIGWPEQKYISDAGKKAPALGGLFVRGQARVGLSAGASELARCERRLL